MLNSHVFHCLRLEMSAEREQQQQHLPGSDHLLLQNLRVSRIHEDVPEKDRKAVNKYRMRKLMEMKRINARQEGME